MDEYLRVVFYKMKCDGQRAISADYGRKRFCGARSVFNINNEREFLKSCSS